MQIAYELHLPISPYEAEAQGIPRTTGRLTLWPKNSADPRHPLAELIYEMKRDSPHLIAQTVVPALIPTELETFCRAHNLACRLDSFFVAGPPGSVDPDADSLIPELFPARDILIDCRSVADIETVLSIDSRAFLFYGASEFESDPATKLPMIEAGRQFPRTRLLALMLAATPLFCLHLPTDRNLEFVGSSDSVNALYLHYRSQAGWEWSVAEG